MPSDVRSLTDRVFLTICLLQLQLFQISTIHFLMQPIANQLFPNQPLNMSSLLTFALVIAAAFAVPIDLESGACAQFTLKAATDLSFNGAVTTIESGEIGLSPGKGLSGREKVKIAPEKILINTIETTDCDSAFTTAYDQAVALPCDAANIFPELAGKTLSPGVYCSGSSMKISDTFVTLDGKDDPNAQWVFQVPTALTTAQSTFFVLQNGAQSKNVFWALGTSATIGLSSSFVGMYNYINIVMTPLSTYHRLVLVHVVILFQILPSFLKVLYFTH
jgi:hypothetical protein